MGISIGAIALTLSLGVGQVLPQIGAEERDFQMKVFRQWWGRDLVWKFEDLPVEGKVTDERVPYSGYIYPDTAGGTMSELRKYDEAFNGGELLATAHEKTDTSARETVTRPVTYSQRFGLFGGQVRTFTVMETFEGTPAWYGHCNGWTSAAIRHAEPIRSVTRNDVTFSPADIKGLLAEIYMYNDPQMLAGDDTPINAGVFHVIMTNWLGLGSHPIGMEAEPGEEKWNYPVHAYTSQSSRWSPQEVEIGMNITYAMSSRGEFEQSPRIPVTMYFHYLLNLDDDGRIVGGEYFRDSSSIDMLWVPLRPKPGGEEGNERGNPYVDVKEVLAIWRDSVPDDVRRNWTVIDPPNDAPVITSADSFEVAENQTFVAAIAATDRDLKDALGFVAPQQLTFSVSGGADRRMFTIDGDSGELSFAQAPNFEQPSDDDQDNLYEVEVMADDGAGGTASQQIRVRVSDANDLPFFTSDSTWSTVENQLAVLTVKRDDEDQPRQSLKCSLSGGADRQHFSIVRKSGKLTFKRPPNFEQPADANQDNIYEVEVLVRDDAGGSATQLFRITVADANDLPVISLLQSVPENQCHVLTVSASDADLPRQTITMSLCGGADLAFFAIDDKTGALTFHQPPDFEQPRDANMDNVYEVEVQVTDSRGGSDIQLLRVAVADVDEGQGLDSDHPDETEPSADD